MQDYGASLGIYGSIVTPPLFLVASKWELQSSARFLLPEFGIKDCFRKIIPVQRSEDGLTLVSRQEVDIYKSLQHQNCFYGNLVTCKSVWVCPVCASKISERRRIELTEAVAVEGYAHALITFTLQHKVTDRLEVVLAAASAALRRFKRGRGFKKFKQRYGWVGDVRSLEITHGVNGWHVHFHMVVFFEIEGKSYHGIVAALKSRWLRMIQKEGFNASWSHGLDFQAGDKDVGHYVAKGSGDWTIPHEVTKGTVKGGRSGGRTPRQLLEDYIDMNDQAGALFKEYALKTKGKNQLYWSLGLRELLGLGAAADDSEIMEKVEDSAILLGSLSADDWKIVRRYGKRGEVLEVAKKGDWDLLIDFIHGLGAASK